MATRYFGAALLAVAVFVFAGGSAAQAPAPSAVRPAASDKFVTHKLASKLMGREMPYRVVLPPGYDAVKSETRHPVVYLLHGLTGHYDNWTERTKLVEYAASHNFIIVTPEGENGWYTDNASKPADRYESYIVKELIPEIDRNYRTLANRENRAIAGLSMGGYGALKFGVKYPEMFALAGSFSGAVGASSYRTVDELPAGMLRNALVGTFGEPGGKTHSENDLFQLIRTLSPEGVAALPFFYVDCGTEDFLFASNREFVNILLEKKVRHEFRQLPGAHNWAYWNSQVEEFLRLASKKLGTRSPKAVAASN